MSEGARIEMGPDRWTFYGADGEVRHQLDFSPSGPAPDYGACDCCERVPAGTVARALAMLGDDRPDVAHLLREALP